MSLRVRFAPSPTGFLHVGGARTALFNWLLARKEGGTFVLRIEDTDRERSSDEMTQVILDAMNWLGLEWDEGPFFQSEGIARHQADVGRLLESGRAYRDFSTPAEVEEDKIAKQKLGAKLRPYRDRALALGAAESRERAEKGDPFAVRCLVPEGATAWNDMVHGPTRFENEDIDDFVILRRDGTPTYNFAVVSDDVTMAITHVIRGDDHLSNTPKQILIYQALGVTPPAFGHVPMILGPDGKRLSKRHGATAVEEYRDRGILADAMVNFLALLGWSPGDDREIMDRPALIEAFSMERVLKKSSVFDSKKLEWLNGKHMALTPSEALEPEVTRRLAGRYDIDARNAPLDYLKLIELLKERARTIDELVDQAVPYLRAPFDFDPKAVRKHWKDAEATAELLRALKDRLAQVQFTAKDLEPAVRGLAQERDLSLGGVVHPLRVALVGRAVSPGMFEVLELMGREPVLGRIDAALELLSHPDKVATLGQAPSA